MLQRKVGNRAVQRLFAQRAPDTSSTHRLLAPPARPTRLQRLAEEDQSQYRDPAAAQIQRAPEPEVQGENAPPQSQEASGSRRGFFSAVGEKLREGYQWFKKLGSTAGEKLREGYQWSKKMGSTFWGRLGGGEVEKQKTGQGFIDVMSPKEVQEYSRRTKGGLEAVQPDWEDSALANQTPTRYQATLAVVQEDVKWYKNISALRNAALARLVISPLQMIKKIVGGKAEDLRDVVAQVLSKQETDWAQKSEQEQARWVDRFTGGLENVGHTWVRLSTYVGGKLQKLFSFGMWPQKTYDPAMGGELGGYAGLSQAGPGEVRHPDVVHESDPTKVYYDTDVSREGFEKALATAAERAASPPAYVLMGYNCTAFAREIIRKAGGAFPGRGLLPGVAFNPGSLYWAVMKQWSRGRERAHTMDPHAKVVKEVGKAQEVRAGEARQSAKLLSRLQKAPQIQVRLLGGKKVRYGLRPDKIDLVWSIAADTEVTQVKDVDLAVQQGVVAIKQGQTFWYIKADDFEAAADKLVGYEYIDDTPPASTAQANVSRTFTAEEAKALRPRRSDPAGWMWVMDPNDYKDYWVRTDQFDRFLRQLAGTYSQPDPKAPRRKATLYANNTISWGVLPDRCNRVETLDTDREVTVTEDDAFTKKYDCVPVQGAFNGYIELTGFEDATEAPVKPAPQPEEKTPKPETESVTPGFYQLAGDQEKFNVVKKHEREVAAVLDRGALVEVLRPDPGSELFVVIRFTDQGKQQEGRLPKAFLSQAIRQPEPKPEGPKEPGPKPKGGTREPLLAQKQSDSEVVPFDDPQAFEKKIIGGFRLGEAGHAVFLHDDYDWMTASTEDLAAFLGRPIIYA